MRRTVLTLVALATLAACSGSSWDGALTLPEPTTTELSAVSVATTEASPATGVATTSARSSSTSTTAEIVPLTDVDLEPATTVLPADIDVTFADAFAVYEVAWAARRAGIEDPSNATVRAEIDRYYIDAARRTGIPTRSLCILDSIWSISVNYDLHVGVEVPTLVLTRFHWSEESDPALRNGRRSWQRADPLTDTRRLVAPGRATLRS